jgi:hypothetical protein
LCRPLPRLALIQSKFQREAANAWLRSGPRQPLAQQGLRQTDVPETLNGDASGLER